jgi:hypothetical protein
MWVHLLPRRTLIVHSAVRVRLVPIQFQVGGSIDTVGTHIIPSGRQYRYGWYPYNSKWVAVLVPLVPIQFQVGGSTGPVGTHTIPSGWQYWSSWYPYNSKWGGFTSFEKRHAVPCLRAKSSHWFNQDYI